MLAASTSSENYVLRYVLAPMCADIAGLSVRRVIGIPPVRAQEVVSMGKVSRSSTTEHQEMEGFQGDYADVDGTTIGFERYDLDGDPAPLFAGLPDDRCQCPHWGVVLKGKLIYDEADGSRIEIGPGEAYAVGPGHLPVFTAGTEIVEFSPTAELAKTIEVVMRNLQAANA
jgi:hypothetical protein